MSETNEPWKLVGDRYSPNLRKWLMRERRWMLNLPLVYRWQDAGMYIGRIAQDDGLFSGARLWGVLNGGTMGTVYSHVADLSQHLREVTDFWDRYEAIGRCAIDTDHSRCFIGGETRWLVNGDERECQWCGQHRQTLHRWTETINRTAWKATTHQDALVSGSSTGGVGR